ncbi:S8 family peptidase [Dongia sp. agr-C8]
MARGVRKAAAKRRHRGKPKPARTKPRAKPKAKAKPATAGAITRRAAQRLIARSIGVRDPNRAFEPIERDPGLLSLVIEAAPTASAATLRQHLEQVYGDVNLERLFPGYRAGEDIPSLRNYYVATLPAVSLSSLIANPHDIAYAAVEKGLVAGAEPDLPASPLNVICKDPRAESHPDKRWSLTQMRVPRAWNKLADAGKDRGGGITIGHIDTGITNHALLSRQTNPIGGFDEIRGTPRGEDPLPSGQSSALGEFFGHGTQTASIIAADPGTNSTELSGIAPDAKLEPMRVTRSVVLVSPSIAAQGIDRAVRQNCDILSISLGGVTGTGVWAAIRNAYARDMLICCAAGQCVPVVVCPALYPQSIAVGGARRRTDAGGGIMEGPWSRSAWGRLDIAASAENVWNATASRLLPSEGTKQSEGTSFAAPAVAAIGALWLRFHDDKGLKARYRRRTALNRVFRQVLAASARMTPYWPDHGWGPGIVDAEAALNASLPPPGPLIPMPQFLLDNDQPDLFGLFERIFWDQPAAAIRAVLGRMFGAADPEALRDQLQLYGGELTRLLQQTEENFDRVRDAVAAEAQGQADRAAEAAHHVAQSASDKLRSVFG